MDLNLFAKRVRSLREHRGWSRRELADLVGVSYYQVVKWELATRGTTPERIMRLCEVFGVTPKQFWDADYIPDSLFANKNAPTTGGVIGAGVPNVDDDGRALVCPRCKYDEHSDIAVYCAECAFPLFNLCSNEERHKNVPSAKFCELCGAKTYWGMDEQELQEHGIPPRS